MTDGRFPIPRIPADGRLAEIARLSPLGWFRDHAIQSFDCECTLVEADRECDVGHALARLAAKEIARNA